MPRIVEDADLVAPLIRVNHGIGVWLEESAPTPGTGQAEAHVLAFVAKNGSCTVNDVHRSFGHRRSTLTSVLDRLEARRLLERDRDQSSRRSVRVTLTPAGRRYAREVASNLDRLQRDVAGQVSERDLQGYRDVLAAFERVVGGT